jgi:branched-chain amino acid transport system substrate-binding protein
MRALLAALLVAFASAAVAQTTYDIPVVLSLSGPAAFLGKQEQQAIELKEKVLNQAGGIHGKPVRFVFHDDATSPQTSVQLTREVLQSKPKVVIGSTLTATCNAMAPLFESGPIMYCLSALVEPKPGYVFTSSVSADSMAEAELRFARSRGWTRVGIVTSTDASGQQGDRSFDKLIASGAFKDMTITDRAHFNIQDVSVAAQVAHLESTKPQAWIGWATGTPMTTVWRGFAQAGIALPNITFGGNMTHVQMTQFASVIPPDLFFVSSEFTLFGSPGFTADPRVAAKQEEMYKTYGAQNLKPDQGSVLGWDAATLVADVLNALPESASPKEIRDHIASRKDQPGVNGLYDFVRTPQRGLSVDNCVVSRWDAAAGRWLAVATMRDLH